LVTCWVLARSVSDRGYSPWSTQMHSTAAGLSVTDYPSSTRNTRNLVSESFEFLPLRPSWPVQRTFSPMEAFQYTSLPVRADTIRVIEIQPSYAQQPITCLVKHVRLTEPPPYEALSYSWGDPTSRARGEPTRSAALIPIRRS
jgi:hypothetical protein